MAHILDENLDFAIEAEKDSFLRHDPVGPETFLDTLSRLETTPDVVCMSGWSKGLNHFNWGMGAGYSGVSDDGIVTRKTRMLGQEIEYFSSTHERSHIWSAYGLSPFPQGKPSYCLVWEGILGRFYKIDEELNITAFPTVIENPGYKYAFVYSLADPRISDTNQHPYYSNAGKLMALAAFYDGSPLTNDDADLINTLLDCANSENTLRKLRFVKSKHYNVGVLDQQFKNFAWHFSQALYNRFFNFAREKLLPGLPLLIAGGCGLNCDWNSAWRNSGFFSDVFVPPCANDTGSALGTAIDAMRHFTGNAKIDWSVYAGQEFVDDEINPENIEISKYDADRVASLLNEGKILGHANGRAEMGPRALGNRTILASPFLATSLERLNSIKLREPYRPIAPIVREGFAPQVFSPGLPSPHMLYFDKVTTDALPAITHIDGSTRIQTVTPSSNPRIHELLCAFEDATGYGVLCNTSLNFLGRGFINKSSDLMRYAKKFGLDGFVAQDRLYLVRS